VTNFLVFFITSSLSGRNDISRPIILTKCRSLKAKSTIISLLTVLNISRLLKRIFQYGSFLKLCGLYKVRKMNRLFTLIFRRMNFLAVMPQNKFVVRTLHITSYPPSIRNQPFHHLQIISCGSIKKGSLLKRASFKRLVGN
jgi:hypothetical protein